MKKYSKKSILNIQRIGIPRGFYYYLYPGLWETFFRGIGIEPVLTGKSSRRTLELAVPCSESEHCLAHKIFDGHLKSLQDQVDAVFIPRLLSMKKRHICCAKFGALPDASRLGAASSIPVVSVELNENRESLTQTLTRLAKNLGVDKAKAQRSVSTALADMAKEKEKHKSTIRKLPPTGRFLLLGHPYTLEDDFISGPVKRKLNTLGVPVELMTFGEGPKTPFPVRWCTFNSIYHRLQELELPQYAGVIQISTFNCGPDSVMVDKYRRVCRNRSIPYLLLMLDEHTASAGIETRLEAFCDSIKWKQNRMIQNREKINYGSEKGNVL